MIKVILKEPVPGQGNKGDIVNVSDGFARNYLLSQDKAIVATDDAIKKIEDEKSKSQLKEEKAKEENIELKGKIESMEIEIKKKAKKGNLFGGLSAKEISGELERKNLKIDPKKIKIKTPVKSVGMYNIGIVLDKNIQATLRVKVSEEK